MIELERNLEFIKIYNIYISFPKLFLMISDDDNDISYIY